MKSKLIISYESEGESFGPIEIPSKYPMNPAQWQMIERALPFILAQAEKKFNGMANTSAVASMTADFELIKGDKNVVDTNTGADDDSLAA